MEKGIHLHTPINHLPVSGNMKRWKKFNSLQVRKKKQKKNCSNKLIFKSQSNIILVTWVNLGGCAN